MGKLRKNVILNIFYQCFAIFIPLVTAPYISRVVGVEGVGIYSYTYSVAFMFSLFILLGINNYGNRTIAFNFDDKTKYSKLFIELYSIQFIGGVIVILTYFVYCFSPLCTYKNISLLQGIYVISSIFDVSWFYFGLDKFKVVVIRSTVIKLISLFFVFYFINSVNDLWKYTLIMALGVLIGQIFLFLGLIKIIKFEKVAFSQISIHFLPNLILFIPVVSVSLYKIVDKIMISNMSTVSQTGIFENAEKIVNVPIMLITAIGTVMLPFASKLVKSDNYIDLNRNINITMKNISTVSSALVFGLASIGHDLIIIYYGKQFEESWKILALLLITVFFISWANVIRTQFIIPKQEDNIYVRAVIGGALINVILNLVFVPIFSAMGAVYSTIVSEVFVAVFQTYCIRRNFDISSNFRAWGVPLLSGMIMYMTVASIGLLFINIYIRLIIQILVGVISYITAMAVLLIKIQDNDYIILGLMKKIRKYFIG